MTDLTILVRDDSVLAVKFTAEALSMRESALALSGLIGRVTNADEQQSAVSAQAALQTIVRQVETARKNIKAPVLEFGQRIDGAAKSFREELDAELLRISRLVGDFQALEAARVRSEEATRLKDLAELERIREAALAKATSHEEREMIQAVSEQKAAELPVSAPVRTEGQIVRSDWEITVSDVHALYRCHPFCVTLTPRLLEIRQLLDQGIKVAGVTARREIKSGVRV